MRHASIAACGRGKLFTIRHPYFFLNFYTCCMTSIQASSPAVPAVPGIAIASLALAAFASGISLRVTDPLLPRLAGDFTISLGEASHVITFFSIAYGFSQLFFGPLGDRFGKYLIIACACVASAVAALLCGLASNFSMLLAARLLAGATAAAVIPLSMAWIGDVIPYERRQPVLARFLLGQILGLSAGVLVGGIAADHFSWRTPFFGISLVFVVVSVVLFLLNRRLPAYAKAVHIAEGTALARIRSEFGQVLAKPWARVILVSVFLEGAFLYGSFAFIASHVHRVHGLSLTLAGSLVMLFGFGGVLFAISSKVLVRELAEAGLAKWGGLLMAGSLFMVGIAPVWWWTIPACFLAGLGFYMFHNTLQTNATQMAPERRGAAVAAFAACFFLGQSVGVALAGMLIEHATTTAVLLIGAAGVGMVSTAFSRLRLRHG